MSMSSHVVGFRPPDEKWKAMKAIWDACVIQCVDIAKQVTEFFGMTDGDPDPSGASVDIVDAGWVAVGVGWE